MIPVIQAIHSPDVYDLAAWAPANPAEINVLLELTIGPTGTTGGDLFQVQIATPDALSERFTTDYLLTLRGTFLVLYWDWQRVRGGLERVVSRCQDATWEQAAQKLSRFFLWEFEDYGLEET